MPALALASPGIDPRFLEGLAACDVCCRSRAVVEWWSEHCDHPSPLVWPEYATAPSLLVPLLDLPPDARLKRITEDETLQHWGLAILALEESRHWRRSLEEALELAVFAMSVASTLPDSYYGAQPVATLRTAILLQIAELQLRSLDTAAARESLAAAHHFWPSTSRPPHLLALLSHLDEVLSALELDRCPRLRLLKDRRTA
jgi:hypothetical protein